MGIIANASVTSPFLETILIGSSALHHIVLSHVTQETLKNSFMCSRCVPWCPSASRRVPLRPALSRCVSCRPAVSRSVPLRLVKSHHVSGDGLTPAPPAPTAGQDPVPVGELGEQVGPAGRRLRLGRLLAPGPPPQDPDRQAAGDPLLRGSSLRPRPPAVLLRLGAPASSSCCRARAAVRALAAVDVAGEPPSPPGSPVPGPPPGCGRAPRWPPGGGGIPPAGALAPPSAVRRAPWATWCVTPCSTKTGRYIIPGKVYANARGWRRRPGEKPRSQRRPRRRSRPSSSGVRFARGGGRGTGLGRRPGGRRGGAAWRPSFWCTAPGPAGGAGGGTRLRGAGHEAFTPTRPGSAIGRTCSPGPWSWPRTSRTWSGCWSTRT